MKTTKSSISKLVVGCVLACCLSSVIPQARAIEDLKISVVVSNVVLSWPSAETESYIVQYRPSLTDTNGWQTLATDWPADSGTNLTFFVHTNAVQNPVGGGSYMAMASGGGLSSLSSATATLLPLMLLAIPTNGLGSAVPLALYPPGVDLSKFLIYDPVTDLLCSSAEYTASLSSRLQTTEAGLDGGFFPTPMENSSSTLAEPETGFYRVVRTGVHLVGITNGTVLSGTISLRFEFGNPDTNRSIDQVFLTDNDSDSTIPGSSFLNFTLNPLGSASGVWDTLQGTNGIYALQLGALLDDGSVATDTPITVTVSNVIYTPDPWNVGGVAIYGGFKTIFTNGDWHLDIYDDQDTYLGYLDGTIDADGYCNYPGIPGPGFSLDNTDGNGNQNPSTSYLMVMAARPETTPPSTHTSVTDKVFIEPAWNYYTRAVVCYEQIFQSWQPGADEVRLMVNAIWNVEEVFHQNRLGTFVMPYEIQGSNEWAVVTNSSNLGWVGVSDFFYFGHGSSTKLGSGAGLTLAAVQKLLANNFSDPLTATNRHPYRFVFLDGCNTADGDWPQAFGIPKKQGMSVADFTQKRGIRPRAFMGWNRKKVVGTGILSGGSLFPPHMEYIGKFWDWWGNGGSGGRNVSDAIDQAKQTAPNGALGMTLFGAEDLWINY